MDLYKFLFLNVFFLVCSTGCVSVPKYEESAGPGGFGLKGKVAVRDGSEQFTANLLWQQRGEDFEIDLWGPLGQGRVQLKRQDGRITLIDGQGEVLTEGDPQAVMQAHLGWSLPMDVLPAWVQGAPLAGVSAANVDAGEQGDIAAFDQLGWHVELERYQSVAHAEGARRLPGRLTAENGPLRLKLVISDWQI